MTTNIKPVKTKTDYEATLKEIETLMERKQRSYLAFRKKPCGRIAAYII